MSGNVNLHPLRDPQKEPDEGDPDIDPFTLDKLDAMVIFGLLAVLIGVPILFHIFYNLIWPCK